MVPGLAVVFPPGVAVGIAVGEGIGEPPGAALEVVPAGVAGFGVGARIPMEYLVPLGEPHPGWPR